MINNPNTLPPAVQAWADDLLLAVKTPNLIHSLGAQRRRIPAKSGNTWRGSRYDRLRTAPVPLGPSGATPAPATLNRTDIDAKIEFYGLYVAINQQVTLQNEDPVLNEVGELLGLSLKMTEDQLMRDLLQASAAQYNCSGGGNGDTPTNLSDADLEEVTALLAEEDAKMIFSSIEAEDKIGSGPQRDAFLAMGHVRLLKDLQNLPNFFSKWNYPNQNRSLPAEWGSVENIRFMLSSVGAIEQNASALGADVYDIFVQGLEGVGCVYQDNFTSRLKYNGRVKSSLIDLETEVVYN